MKRPQHLRTKGPRQELQRKGHEVRRDLLENPKSQENGEQVQVSELVPHAAAHEDNKQPTQKPEQQKKIRPQDDFDAFINGAWASKVSIPRSQSSWGPWQELNQKIHEQIRVILKDLDCNLVINKGAENTPTHAENLLKTFWRSGLSLDSDDDAVYKKSYANCKATLYGLLATVNSNKSLGTICGELLKYDIGPINFAQIQDQDPKRTNEEPNLMVNLVADGLGLRDPSYYLDESDEMKLMRHGYLSMIYHIDEWIKLDPDNILNARDVDVVEAITQLEVKLAEAWPSPEVMRQNDKTYNKVRVSDLKKKYSSKTTNGNAGWSWLDWLKSSKFDEQLKDDCYVIVQSPEYLKSLAELGSTVHPEVWRAYLRFSIIRKFGMLIRPMLFHDVLSILLTGQQDLSSHYEQMLGYINDCMGDVLGLLYVKKHFSQKQKTGVLNMIKNLKKAFRKRILNLDWMEQETKDQAIYKLDKLKPLIGYSEVIPEYTDVPTLREDNVIYNYMFCLEYNYDGWRHSIGKPQEPGIWAMHPHVINAYCDFEKNEIVFPAAILQAPFYDSDALMAHNYGAIGAIIGHEITHAFDDQGALFDAHGRTVNWWTDSDRREFEKRTEKIVKQFDGIKMAGVTVNGETTQGENIADLGGIVTAYDAMMENLRISEEDENLDRCHNDRSTSNIDNYVYEKQQFFVSWAFIWREIMTEEALRDLILTDCHAPHKLRINIPLSNMIEFYEAFHVKKGDKLYRESKDRVKIW